MPTPTPDTLFHQVSAHGGGSVPRVEVFRVRRSHDWMAFLIIDGVDHREMWDCGATKEAAEANLRLTCSEYFPVSLKEATDADH